jgi:hypothetical protein
MAVFRLPGTIFFSICPPMDKPWIFPVDSGSSHGGGMMAKIQKSLDKWIRDLLN